MSQIINEKMAKEIDKWVAKFPSDKKKSAVLMALRIVQDEYKWLKKEHVQAVADYLDVPNTEVGEVLTFYSLYQQKPVGNHTVKVCTSLSCCLNGAYSVLGYVENELGIKCGQTTKDGQITLQEAECIAACADAPAMIIDDKDFYRRVTPEKVKEIISNIKDGDRP
jgi:NADH-quinone oxidoreductase subunit E|tara:strand:+ start:14994 stop:15491 length:498 start_codon:yes stop_codon:yes gene_type:complete